MAGTDRGGRPGPEDRDDMDWLYRRDDEPAPQPSPPEPTRVFGPDAPADPPAGGGRRRASFGDPGGPARSRTESGLPHEAGPAQRRRSALPPAAPPPRPPASPPRPAPARPGPAGRPRRGHPVRRTLLALLIAWLVFLIATPIYAWTQTTKIEAMPSGSNRPDDQPGTLWLLVGSDGREDLSKAERERLSTGGGKGRRTDTIMLLYRPTIGKPALISVPRDSFVRIPGKGKNKINAAYAFGGPQLLIETIEQNTGLRVDRYAEIGFAGFAGMVDAVGGVEVCPKKAIKDRRAGLDIKAGCQNVDGPTALGYVRTRYTDATGDIARTQRQREVIGKIAKKVASPVTFVNPVRYWGVNMAAARSFGVDEQASPIDVGLMGQAMLGTSGGDGLTLMIPISDANARTSAGSSMIWDIEQAEEMFADIKSGDTSKLDRFRADS
ncbi:LCP family protein required for cell wall assembly [Naumannella cuiyingiana]|uniref:LCP family protein required for cell wall assembly n=1 Tax=Naumannella cuiyingiana TaxID=1347891 RepID=A0A7Z0D794_9ACTN|nr:LCP family protein [Naumannella cuiyingiana]NYI70193.1 LCP family protein required for cell wall assembly [Naumannella cuiyingiana]